MPALSPGTATGDVIGAGGSKVQIAVRVVLAEMPVRVSPAAYVFEPSLQPPKR